MEARKRPPHGENAALPWEVVPGLKSPLPVLGDLVWLLVSLGGLTCCHPGCAASSAEEVVRRQPTVAGEVTKEGRQPLARQEGDM